MTTYNHILEEHLWIHIIVKIFLNDRYKPINWNAVIDNNTNNNNNWLLTGASLWFFIA